VLRYGLAEMGKNSVMTFPIKKRINTELFIGKRAELLYTKEVMQTFWQL